MRKFTILIISLFMLSIMSISAAAFVNRFDIVFPECFEKITDNKWHTDAFLINGAPTTVDASVSFEDSKYAEEVVFSEQFLSEFKTVISSSDSFDSFDVEPKEITAGKHNYRCIYTSYVSEFDGGKHNIIILKFYSKTQCCTIEFVANAPLFPLVLEGGGVISSISLDESFFIMHEEEIIVETFEKKESQKISFSTICLLMISLLLFINIIFLHQPNCKCISEKKEKINAKGVKWYITKRESLKIVLYIILSYFIYQINHTVALVTFLIISITPALRIITICLNSTWFSIISAKCLGVTHFMEGGPGDEYSTACLELTTNKGKFKIIGLGSKKISVAIKGENILIVYFKFIKNPYMLMIVPDSVKQDF